MRVVRVFPRKTKWTPTDDFAFIGDPPILDRPEDQPILISCTFTWDIFEAKRLFNAWSAFYRDVKIGGPAFGDPGDNFEPGLFLKHGITITSRGCPKNCPWCMVPNREGHIRECKIKPGHIVQDNNLLACSIEHVRTVFEMLRKQNRAIYFKGGLDTDFITDEHIDLLKSIKIGEMWFACDYPGAEKSLEKIAHAFSGMSRRKLKCYTMIGFNGESKKAARKRIKAVYDMGFEPFAALYQSPDHNKNIYDAEWRKIAKMFSRPAAMKAYFNPKNDKQIQLFNN
jgi:hypothetical protein